MRDRDTLIVDFLRANGWNPETSQALANDASSRRYYRLHEGMRHAILMDAPPQKENIRSFTSIARHLGALGYATPKIFAEDLTNGLLLIEDFGDQTYTNVLKQEPEREGMLYALAIDVLIDLHHRPITQVLPAGLQTYDSALLSNELLLFLDWHLPAITGSPTKDSTRKSYLAAWRDSLTLLANEPPTLVLRDFHVDNLMWLRSRNGIEACGLLDFQDAVMGPAAYDLMSLLEDARRDISSELVNTMINRYFNAFPDLDYDSFSAVFKILAAQRHAKVIGIFTRLSARDGKLTYLRHIPRVWKLLEASLKHPALTLVQEWFTSHVPKELRPNSAKDT